MKLGLALMTLLFPMLAWTQGVGGGGNTGGGVKIRTFKMGCIEGSTGWMSLYVRGEVRSVPRICRDGSFMTPEERESYIYNPTPSCTEGSYFTADEYDYAIGKEVRVVRKCQNNKWVVVRSQAK
ncbi:hypothetical protein AZI86_17630 [Bdellovibrio bacteriovorus]|uniref:Secreted protein n=1 Tax=Bdellovibrio bacteriovorus TaxID=959 RepID=A0A150WEI5_BDEBC|nr:hypothetical protein [Bdellovibrio bacteriovorus]KYG61528.1 hypothetical protein AZI86_17630 [Bdellovibrio bacteriovorus]